MSQRRPAAPGSGLARVRESLEASARAKLDTLELSGARIAEAGQLLVERLRAGGRVLACGNGGSAADAQPLAAELAGRFDRERRALALEAVEELGGEMLRVGRRAAVAAGEDLAPLAQHFREQRRGARDRLGEGLG